MISAKTIYSLSVISLGYFLIEFILSIPPMCQYPCLSGKIFGLALYLTTFKLSIDFFLRKKGNKNDFALMFSSFIISLILITLTLLLIFLIAF